VEVGVELEGVVGDGGQAPEFEVVELVVETPEEPLLVGPRASLWVDVATYDILAIHSVDGTRVRLGPPAVFGQIRIPSWIVIEERGRSPVRFEVVGAAAVDAPAAAFSPSWLTTRGASGFGDQSDPAGAPAPSTPTPEPLR